MPPEEPIFGLGMVEELARHGYRISPGTLYPLLHGLEKKGYLRSAELRNGKSLRKVYRATPLGGRRWGRPQARCANCFGNSWKASSQRAEATMNSALDGRWPRGALPAQQAAAPPR